MKNKIPITILSAIALFILLIVATICWFSYEKRIFGGEWTYANQVCRALDMYAADHEGLYPQRLHDLIPNYIEQRYAALYFIPAGPLQEDEYIYEPYESGKSYGLYNPHSKERTNMELACKIRNHLPF